MTASELLEESVAGVAGVAILATVIPVALVAAGIYFVLLPIAVLIEAVTQ